MIAFCRSNQSKVKMNSWQIAKRTCIMTIYRDTWQKAGGKSTIFLEC